MKIEPNYYIIGSAVAVGVAAAVVLLKKFLPVAKPGLGAARVRSRLPAFSYRDLP